MSFNPILPVTYNNSTYLFGSDLNANFSTLMANDIDLNARINSIAGGYNEVDLEFTGASLSYSGATYVSGKPVFLAPSAVTVTGSAGWRYAVCTDAGVVSIEGIPGGEITADILQYTPEPVLNTTYNGYYSSVNPAKRIIGICYFDSTNITEVIPYGSGRKKNDDFWYSQGSGIQIGTNNLRFQYTASFARTRGTNIVIVDNGSGSTDSEGFRITINGSGILNVSLDVSFSLIGSASSALNIKKNGASFRLLAALLYNTAGTFNLSFFDQVQPGDYFTFYQNTVSGSAATSIDNPSVRFTEY